MDETVNIVGQLMVMAARTAPKAGGKDYIELKLLQGEEIQRLAEAMEAFGRESGKQKFDRDGNNVQHSSAVLLIALKKPRVAGLNCGACGYSRCSDLPEEREGPEFRGPICAWRLLDLGIALGSAVKTASILNADNRIMYRAGIAARRLGLIEGNIVVGVPLSASGKNIYFDR